ncbi:MAG: sulfite exporter TauE/SafE family protein [Actinomycetota bacterium]
MFLAAIIQGSVGFGANVVAVPTLFLIDPAFVPIPALFAGFGINILMLWRDRQATTLRPVATALAGRVVGTALGIAALGAVSEQGLGIIVAVVVFAVVGAGVFGLSADRSPTNLLTGGVFSGFGASTAGIGGPPVALLFQNAEGPEVRGSLGAFFVVGNVISLSGMALAGFFGPEELRLGLLLTPAAVAGFACTRWVVPHIDRGHTRTAILAASAAAALALLLKLLW